MTGGDLSREILISYIWVSTIPTTNELYTWPVARQLFSLVISCHQSFWISVTVVVVSCLIRSKIAFLTQELIIYFEVYTCENHHTNQVRTLWSEPGKNKCRTAVILQCFYYYYLYAWQLLLVAGQLFSAGKRVSIRLLKQTNVINPPLITGCNCQPF